jgi:hypothetical protein
MDLVRDVLDKPVVDRHGREMGRVDGIVLERREGAPPTVVGLEIGPAVLGHRLHPLAGRVVESIEYVSGLPRRRAVRIAFADIVQIDVDIKVNAAIAETGAGIVEQGLRAWLRGLPGGR